MIEILGEVGTGIIFLMFWGVCALLTPKSKLRELERQEIEEVMRERR